MFENAFVRINECEHTKPPEWNSLLDEQRVPRIAIIQKGKPCGCGSAVLKKARSRHNLAF